MRSGNPNRELHRDTPHIGILAFSRLARDRRVLRQCSLVQTLGFNASVVAYANSDDDIPYDALTSEPPTSTTTGRLRTLAFQLPSHLGLRAAEIGFWINERHKWALRALHELKPQIVIANDWPALVVAAEYKRQTGCQVHYDTHEFATLEFDERAWWRYVYKPMVTHLEAANIHLADSVSTVGAGLANALQEFYGLATTPAVIRNTPDRIPLSQTFETKWPLRILYHGQILPDRGLEILIKSMPEWRAKHQVTIRGDGPANYCSTLRQLSERLGVAEQITFAPAVPPDEVMPTAATNADLGVHFTPLGTPQRHFSLPNKFFEYIGAGLAVAVSPGADMKKIVESWHIGVTSADADPPAVAQAINSLTREDVTEYRHNARRAAAELCWDYEKMALTRILNELTSRLRFNKHNVFDRRGI